MELSPPRPADGRLPDTDLVHKTLLCVGQALGVRVTRTDVEYDDDLVEPEGSALFRRLSYGAKHSGILLREVQLTSTEHAVSFLKEGFPIIVAKPEGSFAVLGEASGRKFTVTEIGARRSTGTLSQWQMRSLLFTEEATRTFVAKKELECEAISAAVSRKHDGGSHPHPTPLRRFLGLLALDRRDIGTVFLFATVAGILALATPLAVESLVNVVSWGTYLQPLIVLGVMLLICLGLSGILRVLQTVLVEIIQRRQFVRIVGDLAHRFPRANQASLVGTYPRELANRIFDIMTIQKATAVLLFDGVTIVLSTFLGMLLLAFYHPFLLGFDIVLLIAMISITWLLGRGGIDTAVDESVTKYKVAHWLQDVIASPAIFKTGGGEALAIERANELTSEYIAARQSQFRVVLRQVSFAIALQAIASTALLALGGWLVIEGQLTLGQLVASELVVTIVVGAFSKAGKSLEKFYDLMAGIDKVGYLLDVPPDARHEVDVVPQEPVAAKWDELSFAGLGRRSRIPAAEIEAGSRTAIVGNDITAKSLLAKSLAGLVDPDQGLVQVGGIDAEHAASAAAGKFVAYAGGHDVFHGTLRENIDLGRSGISLRDVRKALDDVGLAETVWHLPDGVRSELQTGGYPLSPTQVAQLVIARAIVAEPRLLVIDGLLDELDRDSWSTIWKRLTAIDAPWTLVVVTNLDEIASACDSEITLYRT